ncbi:hypothetical protein CYMTET_56436 [Cymbomonas tetramitiformis]|uniref:Uncharacterized protein n=1 Tax=Cymbomonas tetramitiformis TaxID=36881 RepID=A0AAE0BC41_9CHLO|nr:hypothetical protein CYMTET_56436 [Cymbomonas tetramitiformis]
MYQSSKKVTEAIARLQAGGEGADVSVQQKIVDAIDLQLNADGLDKIRAVKNALQEAEAFPVAATWDSSDGAPSTSVICPRGSPVLSDARRAYAEGVLCGEHTKRLEDEGFDFEWSVKNNSFEQIVAMLRHYLSVPGNFDLDVPTSFVVFEILYLYLGGPDLAR